MTTTAAVASSDRFYTPEEIKAAWTRPEFQGGHERNECVCGQYLGGCRCAARMHSQNDHRTRTYLNGCWGCQWKSGLPPTLASDIPTLTPHEKSVCAEFTGPIGIDLEKVADIAETIKHCGDYGLCFVHPEKRMVFWDMADGDGSGGYHDADELDSEKTIRAKFAAIPGVDKVEIGDEYNPPRNAGWIMVHPRRANWSITSAVGQERHDENEVVSFLDDVLKKFID